jgi:enoyl-CoA hydratase/carnithine racemase
MHEYVDILGEFEMSEKPTLAAVHGVCSSGGLELALAFDQIWAAAGTKVGSPKGLQPYRHGGCGRQKDAPSRNMSAWSIRKTSERSREPASNIRAV